jgi:hypothetical protein
MILLEEIFQLLESRAAVLRSGGDLPLAFAAWLAMDSVAPEDITRERDRCLAMTGAQRRYSDVASLGFLSRCLPSDDLVYTRMTEGLMWMGGRSIRVDGGYADFCGDSLALLGMSLGIGRMQTTDPLRQWFAKVLDAAVCKETDWEGSLRELARSAIDQPQRRIIGSAVKVLGFAKGILKEEPTSSDADHVIALLKMTTLLSLSDPEAYTVLFAFKYLERSQPLFALQTPSVQSVAMVLSNLASGLTRWTWETKAKTAGGVARKWHIDNEYHVQNLLWCVLRPLFPDAREEEYKSAVGKVHPRLDIVLPSLRLIIEVKFWRSRDSSKEMVREIAEDSGLYLTADRPFDAILPVIWDDGRRVEEHDSLKSALTEIVGVVYPVIVAKPGLMSDLPLPTIIETSND